MSLTATVPSTPSAQPPKITEAAHVAPFAQIDNSLTFYVEARADSHVEFDEWSRDPLAGAKRAWDEDEGEGGSARQSSTRPTKVARHEKEQEHALAAEIERKDREIAALRTQLAEERTARLKAEEAAAAAATDAVAAAANAVAAMLLANAAVLHARSIMDRSLALSPLPAASNVAVAAALRAKRAAKLLRGVRLSGR
ncbi:hypothetical protein T484DRAFT_1864142 [Baffinella frigidus]|nr:hypothetical protein T484DRAFT_1866309 [Cryptophyta sp. CCMP2293]KAJ1465605.1 hypothetical protein T484DRAFT_1864142 [Cryptophyta sp. CCMP2293]